MVKPAKRTYSRYSLEALQLLGKMIKLARTERKLTAQDLAERAGISRGLLQRIEKGDPKCAIGAAFEVATIVGVKLFQIEGSTLSASLERVDDKLALLPKAVIKKSMKVVRDDF